MGCRCCHCPTSLHKLQRQWSRQRRVSRVLETQIHGQEIPDPKVARPCVECHNLIRWFWFCGCDMDWHWHWHFYSASRHGVPESPCIYLYTHSTPLSGRTGNVGEQALKDTFQPIVVPRPRLSPLLHPDGYNLIQSYNTRKPPVWLCFQPFSCSADFPPPLPKTPAKMLCPMCTRSESCVHSPKPTQVRRE